MEEGRQHPKQLLSNPGFWLRLMNMVFYVILLIVYFEAKVPQNEIHVGIVYGSDEVVESIPQPNGTIIGTWGDLGHPIILNNELCTVGTLWSCVNEDATGVCCDELRNTNSNGPESAVSENLLLMISIVIPLILICLRIAIMAFLRVKYKTGSWRTFSGFYSVDTIIGFAAAIIITLFFSELSKRYVGSPRPNFYAYRFWEENAVTGSDNKLNNSIKSWASGHAAGSMAAAVYIVLIIFSDLHSAFTSCKMPIISAAFQSLGHLLCCGIIFGTAFVGFTRIRDYWHHSVDVLTGWIIGALSSIVAFNFVTKGPYDLNMVYDERKNA